MSSVKLTNVTKKYDEGATIINNFNLEVNDNELLVVVGPTGCGKTTLLRLIAGLDNVSSGEIYIANKIINEIHPKDRDIAMIFQNPTLYSHLSVYENMAVSLKQKKVDKITIDENIREAAKILKIEDILNLSPVNISSGQMQRVAIGKAIVRRPKVFLFDEPLSALDPQLRTDLRNQIQKLQQELQTTMIYVTHDQRDAMAIGSRIVVMENGYIQQIDTPSDIYENPSNIFVAGFMGYPRMNFIHGDVRQMGDVLGLTFKNSFIGFPPEKQRKIMQSGKIHSKLVLGLRPEAIGIVDSSFQTAGNTYNAIVENIERTGSDTYVTVDMNGTHVILKAPPTMRVVQGSIVRMAINLNRLHIFDSDLGKTITN